MPATWPEGPTVAAVFDWEAVADLAATAKNDAGTDQVADAVYKGIGTELDALYILERPSLNERNPPTKARGGVPVIVRANANRTVSLPKNHR